MIDLRTALLNERVDGLEAVRRLQRPAQHTVHPKAMQRQGLVQAFRQTAGRRLVPILQFPLERRRRLCSADERVALRKTVVTDARRSLSSGEALLRALRFDREGWALRALVQPADEEEPQSVETEAERWNWLSRPVIDALRAQPAVVERQVARLVRDTANTLHDRGPTTIYAINRERTNALFGTDLPELLRLLANMSSTAEDPVVREAGSQARSWLAELTARGGID